MSVEIPDFNLHKAVQLAVVTEQNGQRFYRRLAAHFRDDPPLHRVFARLAEDEVAHEEQFQRLLDALPEEEPLEQAARPYGASYLRAISISRFFSTEAFDPLEGIATPKDALIQALELEKSTKFYYQELAEVLGDPGAFAEIIAAEKGHIEDLLEVIASDDRFRGMVEPAP